MTEQISPITLPIMQGLQLHHPETGLLFQRSMRIAPEEVAALLALPHDTLAADLRAILKHAEERFDLYKQEEEANGWQWETMVAPLHAVLLLSELPGRENLDAVLGFCSMEDEPLQFHLSDLLTEMMWEPLAKLAFGHFDRMAEFVRTPGPDVFARVIAAEAMNRIADTWPEHKPAVAQWYGEQLQHFAGLSDGDPALDDTVVAALIADCLDRGLKEHLPIIEDLFGQWQVDSGYCGDLATVRQEFIAPSYPARREQVRPLAGTYAEMLGIEKANTALKAEDEKRALVGAYARMQDRMHQHGTMRSSPPVRNEKKVGRNDPCPCGSGKKYKKCCGG